MTSYCPDSLKTFAPELFALYTSTEMDELLLDILLDVIGKGFPFAAATANFGPRTTCKSHRDLKNLAYGLCAIAVFGRFDHRRGGHLVLHELKVVLEMRPGDIAFIPSAVVSHENVPIAPHESRQSLVLYSAGGLFRWVAAKGRTHKVWKEEDPDGYEEHQALGEERWHSGWNLFSEPVD